MKLLIVTQKVDLDDPILGFFHEWIREFALKCEYVTVICLEKGAYDLPENVKVLSLGKEKKRRKLALVATFLKYVWKERHNYDSVFVHMNPIYIVISGVLWRLLHKKISLWYSHKSVDMKLRVATFFSHIVFSSSKASFKLPTKKIIIVGHGIDIHSKDKGGKKSDNMSCLSIGCVGRISRIKRQDILIDAVSLLSKKIDKKIKIFFVGDVGGEKDVLYKKQLKEKISIKGIKDSVQFLGNISHDKIQDFYRNVDITVNLTPEGGMDKVVLESISLLVPAFTSNTAFDDFFGTYKEKFIFSYDNAEDLSDHIFDYLHVKNNFDMNRELSLKVKLEYSVEAVVSKIISTLNYNQI